MTDIDRYHKSSISIDDKCLMVASCILLTHVYERLRYVDLCDAKAVDYRYLMANKNVYLLRLVPRPTDRRKFDDLMASASIVESYIRQRIASMRKDDRIDTDIDDHRLQIVVRCENEENKETGAVVCCPVCGENDLSSKMVALCSDEEHLFCKECVFHYINELINSNKVMDIGCMNENCEESASPEKIVKFLYDFGKYQQEAKYKRFRNSNLAIRWGKKICPNQDCWAILEEVDNGAYRSCNVCMINLCFKCNKLLHPDQECATAELVTTARAMRAQSIANCPNCGIKIYKSEGCNHMVCIMCKHQFCWLCKKQYSLNHYSKFNPAGCPGLQFTDAGRCGVCWRKTRATMFWVMFVILFPLIYVIFLMCLPVYYYIQTRERRNKDRISKGLPVQPDSACKKAIVYPLLGLLGVPFMVIGLALTALVLPCFPLAFLCKCCGSKKSRRTLKR